MHVILFKEVVTEIVMDLWESAASKSRLYMKLDATKNSNIFLPAP